ncbi:MAG TPA: GatB/YqeY domain-containing protein [Gemmatimonadaceae bacterium]|nr:GatB/YqeY domain-containing protein [Gemmatimonadaceae bacterium]
MSELLARLQSDLNSARKARDKAGVLLLGTLLADLKNRRIELLRDLTEDEVRDVLRKGIKRRRESVEMYEKGGREDLASRERDEAARIEQYLPANVSDADIRAAVRTAIAAGATSIGAVMGTLLPQFKGRADGATINRIAREELARPGG